MTGDWEMVIHSQNNEYIYTVHFIRNQDAAADYDYHQGSLCDAVLMG